MSKRILIVTPWYPGGRVPYRGVFVQDQAAILSRKYEVAVLVPGTVGLAEGIRRREGGGLQVDREENITVFRASGVYPLWPYAWVEPLFFVLTARRAYNRLRESWGRPDIVHAHVAVPGGWVGSLIAGQEKIPCVLTIHSRTCSVELTGAARRRACKTLTSVSHVIAVSPALAEELRQAAPAVKPEVIGNVVRTEFFTPEPSPRPRRGSMRRFLCVATLARGKHIRCLIEAAALLERRGIHAYEVTVAGDGPERKGLVDLAEKLGISNRFSFVGMLDRETVRTWMRWCDVFVLPSLAETFGLVLAEAMSCGKPVIATRCGGPEYVVDAKTGILVQKGSERSLADAMEKFVRGRASFDAGAIRKSVVERFGEDAFLHRISALYDEVLSVSAPPFVCEAVSRSP